MLTKLYIKTQDFIQSFKNDERGVTAIEYAMLAVCMSSVVIAMFNTTLVDALTTAMTTITENIGAAGSK